VDDDYEQDYETVRRRTMVMRMRMMLMMMDDRKP